MVLVAAKVALVALTLATVFALRHRVRPALALLVLLVPVALTAPDTFDRQRDGLVRDVRRGERALDLTPWPSARPNLRLVRAAEQRIPREDTYAWAFGGAWADERLSRRRASIRFAAKKWMQWRLAPRLAVPDVEGASWVLVLGARPSAVGLEGGRAWRFGDDWLVER